LIVQAKLHAQVVNMVIFY